MEDQGRHSDGLQVSIQLMSPASGDLKGWKHSKWKTLAKVSIQLMSPASGDKDWTILRNTLELGFHSINVPSEWGHDEVVLWRINRQI